MRTLWLKRSCWYMPDFCSDSTVHNCSIRCIDRWSIRSATGLRDRVKARKFWECMQFPVLPPHPHPPPPIACSLWPVSKALTITESTNCSTELDRELNLAQKDCYHVETAHAVFCYGLQSRVICSTVYTLAILFIQIFSTLFFLYVCHLYVYT